MNRPPPAAAASHAGLLFAAGVFFIYVLSAWWLAFVLVALGVGVLLVLATAVLTRLPRASTYAAYDKHPLDEDDAWGDLATFRDAAGKS